MDDAIDSPKTGFALGDQSLDVFLVRNVGGDVMDLRAFLSELFQSRFAPRRERRAAAEHDAPLVIAGHELREDKAQPTRASGNQIDAAVPDGGRGGELFRLCEIEWAATPEGALPPPLSDETGAPRPRMKLGPEGVEAPDTTCLFPPAPSA